MEYDLDSTKTSDTGEAVIFVHLSVGRLCKGSAWNNADVAVNVGDDARQTIFLLHRRLPHTSTRTTITPGADWAGWSGVLVGCHVKC